MSWRLGSGLVMALRPIVRIRPLGIYSVQLDDWKICFTMQCQLMRQLAAASCTGK